MDQVSPGAKRYNPDRAAIDRQLLIEHCVALRHLYRLSQYKMAEKMGTKQSAISELENGTGGEPKLETIQRYLGVLGHELVMGTRVMK